MNFSKQIDTELVLQVEQITKNILDQVKFSPELAFLVGKSLVEYANNDIEEALKEARKDI